MISNLISSFILWHSVFLATTECFFYLQLCSKRLELFYWRSSVARIKMGDWLTEDGLQQIESWARKGLTNRQIASNIGIGERTFYTWLKPERDTEQQIVQALKRGRLVVESELENALYKKAIGYTEPEAEIETRTILDAEGRERSETVVKSKTYPPDTGANIFILKNRCRSDYQDRPKTEEELEKIRLENEHQRLQNELLKRMLDEDNISVLKIDELIGAIDAKAIEDAE